MEEHLVNSATSINELPTAVDSHLGNPYLNARKEWDERYGSLIKRAQHWRGAAVLALLVALAEAVVILGVATRPKTVPYVVAVDSLGRVVASGAVERSSPVDQRMEAIALTRWIQDLPEGWQPPPPPPGGAIPSDLPLRSDRTRYTWPAVAL